MNEIGTTLTISMTLGIALITFPRNLRGFDNRSRGLSAQCAGFLEVPASEEATSHISQWSEFHTIWARR
jgi:hypothetical protein